MIIRMPHTIKRLAGLVDISRGSVYHHPDQLSDADLRLMRRIDPLQLEHPSAAAARGWVCLVLAAPDWRNRSELAQRLSSGGHHRLWLREITCW
jgi:hypothetical protein